MQYKSFLILIVYSVLYSQLNAQPDHPKAFHEELPFEYIKGKITIPVVINGIKYQFLLDTGGVFEISSELQKAFQFEEIGSATASGINKQKVKLPRVKVPDLSIGNLSFKNRTALVSDIYRKYPSSCYGYAGMIGRDFLDSTILQIDFRYKKLILSNQSEELNLNEEISTPLRYSKTKLPMIKSKLNDQAEEFLVLDLGANDFFSYKRKTAQDLKTVQKIAFYGVFSFGVTMPLPKKRIQYRVKIDSINIANHQFGSFYSDISKESRSRIGSKLIEYGLMTIDYLNDKFYFEPFPHAQPLSSFESFGFALMKLEDRYLVKSVLQGSIADEAGLRYGDIVYKINDQILVNIDDKCDAYITGFDYELAHEIQVYFVNRKGKKKSLVLKKQRYQ